MIQSFLLVKYIIKGDLIIKKDLQATANYLVSGDKDFHERMEFVKTQGGFFKKILEELEGQRQKYRYILDQFCRSAVQLQNFYKRDAQKEEAPQQAREWPQLSIIQSTRSQTQQLVVR